MGHRNDLHIHIGVSCPHRLEVELEELAIPAGLRIFVAECRARGPHLPRQRGRRVLHEHSHQRSSELRTQRNTGAIFVHKVIHLLGDHIGGLAHPEKHTQILEQWRLHFAVAGPPRSNGEGIHQCPSAISLRRNEIGHSFEGGEHGRHDSSRPSTPNRQYNQSSAGGDCLRGAIASAIGGAVTLARQQTIRIEH